MLHIGMTSISHLRFSHKDKRIQACEETKPDVFREKLES